MTRTVLFLQGPMSPFMSRLAAAVEARGARALRVNLCPGDWIFWRRGGATSFRGRPDAWGAFIADYYRRNGVTDIVMFGESRDYHRVAIAEADRQGIRVHSMDLGYLRPDWLTVERDGMGSLSRFPRDPDAVRALAEGKPQPEFNKVASSSFARDAFFDVVYNCANVFLGPIFFPHYRRHALRHPFIDYAWWLGRVLRAKKELKAAEDAVAEIEADPRPMYLVPLQLSTDFQIRAHSPFPRQWDAVEWTMRSFAAHAPAGSLLVFKVHPLDSGADKWTRRIRNWSRRLDIVGRVRVVVGGDLDKMVTRSRGVIVVNSTAAITALRRRRPVITLGAAVFDLQGLTFQGPFDRFWSEGEPPDPALLRDFLAALAWAAQVRGGVITEDAMKMGAEASAERILEEGERLPPRARGLDRFPRREEWLAARAEAGRG